MIGKVSRDFQHNLVVEISRDKIVCGDGRSAHLDILQELAPS